MPNRSRRRAFTTKASCTWGSSTRRTLPFGRRRECSAARRGLWTFSDAGFRTPRCAPCPHAHSTTLSIATRPREELIVLWAEQAAACARIALDHVGDPRDREVVLAAALLRVAGIGNSRGYATPTEPLEIAAATAIFCDALGDASSLRDVQRVLAYPNARPLRDAIAGNVSPSSLAPRIRRGLGNILASMMRS